ncbi:MAG: DUF1109 domain-containing protein [Phenylobacterium sp.]
MRTGELIDLLASDPVAPRPHLVWRRLGWAMVIGFLVAALLIVSLFSALSDRSLLAGVTDPRTLRKIGFVLSVVGVAAWAAARLGQPGLRLGRPGRLLLAAPFIVMALWGVAEIAVADPEWRMRLWFGWTWAVCPFLILGASLPALGACLWAMRGLAPTRLRAAGAAAGMLAGAVGALAYALFCREPGAAYLATWYLAGMLLPAGAGALLGPPVLRW